MEGGGGLSVTQLAAAIDDDDTTIQVDSTAGFLDADYIIIGDEEIVYTGTTATTFTGCTRGCNGTEASAHSIDDNTYTAEASAINDALGFNVAATSEASGIALSALTVPFKFLTVTIPRIVQMNYSFLQGDLAIVAWFFFAAAAGLIIVLAIYLLQVVTNIFSR